VKRAAGGVAPVTKTRSKERTAAGQGGDETSGPKSTRGEKKLLKEDFRGTVLRTNLGDGMEHNNNEIKRKKETSNILEN